MLAAAVEMAQAFLSFLRPALVFLCTCRIDFNKRVLLLNVIGS